MLRIVSILRSSAFCRHQVFITETNQAYSLNIELKLCFLKGDSIGHKINTEYVSGYLPQFEDLESEQYCAIVGYQDSVRI